MKEIMAMFGCSVVGNVIGLPQRHRQQVYAYLVLFLVEVFKARFHWLLCQKFLLEISSVASLEYRFLKKFPEQKARDED